MESLKPSSKQKNKPSMETSYSAPDINPLNAKTTPKTIKELNQEIIMKNIHSDSISALIELKDKRIATGSWDNSISICSINTFTKKWNKDIHKNNAHDRDVNSLCEIISNNTSKLVSCSEDKTIRIWSILKSELIQIKILKTHFDYINKVLTLSNGRFASCSEDCSVKIFEDAEPFQELVTFHHENEVFSAIMLKNREEVLVTSCSRDLSGSISFWDTYIYKKLHTMNGYYTDKATHMTELSDGNIAVSDCFSDEYPIIIIDTVSYTVIKHIKSEGYITRVSSLHSLDDFSFVFVYNEKFLQISIIDYKIMFKSKKESNLDGYYGVITIQKGKYLAITNNLKGITIIKPRYVKEI